jgi:TRAP transporter 4TM/12TM fusion protein
VFSRNDWWPYVALAGALCLLAAALFGVLSPLSALALFVSLVVVLCFVRAPMVTLSVVLCLFTLVAVNYNVLQPQSALAIFIMLGMVLCFLRYPTAKWIKRPEGKQADSPEADPSWRYGLWLADRILGVMLAVASFVCFAYIFVQTEPIDFFREHFWSGGISLGNRAGQETTLDLVVGVAGILLVLEATRRSIGWIVPALATAFILHAYFAPHLPDWALPHAGANPTQIVSSTFLQSLGVLGPAAGVMFKYVFLFVLFGAFLEMSGATKFIIDFSERVFGTSPGGPAKVSVLGSGLMGSLSGSAVANAVTTGSFTIPMMRSAGFRPHISGGITAAAASGGALVPPVMGAGAYMMLEFIDREPQVTFLEIARAALIPAILYYFSLWMIVHLYAKRVGAKPLDAKKLPPVGSIWEFEAVVFFGALGVLVGLLLLGFSPFKAVTGALVLILVLSALRPKLNLDRRARVLALLCFAVVLVLHQLTVFVADWPAAQSSWLKPFLATSWQHAVEGHLVVRNVFDSLLNSSFVAMFFLLIFGLVHPSWRPGITKAMTKSADNGIALVAASACVGLIIGIVQSTPMANDFSEMIKNVVESNLLLALMGIMVGSIVLGMGVPSVVCYLLMATLMGAMLSQLGVDPLAAHLFIFYFGMMSMVTPPVALAAYASASLAEAKIMPTSWAAFRFSLVGFTLPYMFVYRPGLLLMSEDGGTLSAGDMPSLIFAIVVAILGIVALAVGLTGYFKTPLPWYMRVLAFLAAALALIPHVELAGRDMGLGVNLAGLALLGVIIVVSWSASRRAT